MKKIIFFIGLLFCAIPLFSQSYIGKTFGQIVISASHSFSEDSTEMWKKEDVSMSINKPGFQLIIHDISNFKVTTCYFDSSMSICHSFMIVYYNLSKSFVCSLLSKKYKYNYVNEWIVGIDGINHVFCLREEEGEIIIVEACEYISQNLN